MSKEAKEKLSLQVRPPNKFLKSDKLRVYPWRNKAFPVLHQKNSDLLTEYQGIQFKSQYLWHWLLVTF